MDARLSEGIRLFNAGEFFAAHQILEELYLQTAAEEDKPFLEALVELAVAFRLYADLGEVRGVVRMIHQALIRLEPYHPSYLSIRVDKLSRALEDWTQRVSAAGAGAAAMRASIPKIRTALGFFADRG
ncbi:MAG TPA: DUF309 domain-containing protein [Candidatus Acidoferrales bacterium]|nr:DUF309 domain-containing protein [Candidatus Acidoferrales bacterium]